MRAGEHCPRNPPERSNKTRRRKAWPCLLLGPAIDVMIVLARAILGHGRHYFRRYIAHVGENDLRDGFERALVRRFEADQLVEPRFEGKAGGSGFRLQRRSLLIGTLDP